MCILKSAQDNNLTPPLPHPFLQQSQRYFHAEKDTSLQLLFWADLHLFQTRFVMIGCKNNRDGDITMSLSLKTIGSAGYTDQCNKKFGWV